MQWQVLFSGAVLPQSVGFVAVGLPDSLRKANYRKKHFRVLLTSGAYLRFCAEVPYILAPKNKKPAARTGFCFWSGLRGELAENS